MLPAYDIYEHNVEMLEDGWNFAGLTVFFRIIFKFHNL